MNVDDAIHVLKDPDSWLTLDYDCGEPEACADHHLIVACQMGADALAKRQWIPVSERLPESGKVVLLIFKNTRFPVIGYYSSASGLWKTLMGGQYPFDLATHYQELPEPPGGDE